MVQKSKEGNKMRPFFAGFLFIIVSAIFYNHDFIKSNSMLTAEKKESFSLPLHSQVTRGLREILEADIPPPINTSRRVLKAPAVMVAGQKAIYTVENGRKHLIPDWDTFCNLGYDLSSVKYITQQEMNSYPDAEVLKEVAESGHRDYKKECPCHSKSRQPYTLNKDLRIRNICFLKNKPFDELFTKYYELNLLQNHLKFYLIDDEHIKKDEIERWKLYNTTINQYNDNNNNNNSSSNSNINENLKDKYTSYPTIGSFVEADKEDAKIIETPKDAQNNVKEEIKKEEEKEKEKSTSSHSEFVYDSDVDPYPSPYFTNSNELKTPEEKEKRNRKRKLKQSNENAAELNSSGQIKCDVIIEVMPETAELASHVCPGVCLPHPRAYISIDALLPEPKHPEKDLTCSLTLEHIFASPTTNTTTTTTTTTTTDSNSNSNSTKLRKRSLNDVNVNVQVEEPNPKDSAHARLALIIHTISRRKMEECTEREYWLPAKHKFNQLNKKTMKSLNTDYIIDPPKRKVRGLIIWIGSLSRFSMARAQIEVLKSQMNIPSKDRIIGWLATEEIYDCRLGTTTCTTLSPQLAYYNYMPTSILNVKNAGYNCAQRRPLRSMSHVLHLFDPDFLLVVDDDTWVNIDMLKLDSGLSSLLNKDFKEKPIVMGQLTAGRKITRHGFFYGGAGYLIGKNVIDRLVSNTLYGPSIYEDSFRDPTQMEKLQLMYQTAVNAREVCIDTCITNKSPTKQKGVTTNTYGDHFTFNNTRVIDICMNIMSEEHTCYASDHAISRCLAHGVYADIVHIDCSAQTLATPKGDILLGMCMGIDKCNNERQFTCHRWMADPKNYKNPIPNAWTEKDTE